jgi:hypothetical protein
MNHKKKIILKTLYEGSRSHKKNPHFMGFKKDIETVLRLSIHNYPNIKTTQSSNLPNIKNMQTPKKKEEANQSNINEFNSLALSIRKLKTFYPNIKDEVFNENYANGQIPSRTEHINFENNLKESIKILTQREDELKKKQEVIGNEIKNLDIIINDQQLSIDVIMNIDNNTLKLTKIFTEQKIREMNLEKDKRTNYLNSKEFQEQLNLFLLREDYSSKQKAKEIDAELEENKAKKNNKLKELNKVSDSYKKVHDKKKKQVEDLYMHYLIILKEGKDTRNEGLSWIIREIFNLDKKVIISFFPKFLDKQCIQYLFNVTHVNMKLTELEKQIKKCKNDFKDQGLLSHVEKHENDLLTERKNISKENLKIIKRRFSQSFNQDKIKRENSKNQANNTVQNFSMKNKMYQKMTKTHKLKKFFNNTASHKLINSIVKTSENKDDNDNDDEEDNLPYIDGDPNDYMGKKGDKINYTNTFIKNQLKSTFKIPNIIRLKDFDKMNFIKTSFTPDDIVKVNNFFSLRKKFNKLREEKDMLKTNEMDRIFKEFQRNNYSKRYNVDKMQVISALIGEDNINNELFRQERREKNYFEQISKSLLYTKKINYKAFNEKSNSKTNN